MNRISLLQAQEVWNQSAPQDRSLLGKGPTEEAEQAFFLPEHYEPKYRYPLLIWLHGSASDECEISQLMPLLSLRNYLAVAPRGTTVAEGSRGPQGFTWGEDSPQVDEATCRVFESIAQAKKNFSVHSDRIFIGGAGQGGTLAMRLAMYHPTRFAGAFTLGGPFPAGDAPLRHLLQARSLRLLIGQGRESDQYEESLLCDHLRLLHTAGMNITVRQYPCGNELTDQMLLDLNSWMMEQITGQPAEEKQGDGKSSSMGDTATN